MNLRQIFMHPMGYVIAICAGLYLAKMLAGMSETTPKSVVLATDVPQRLYQIPLPYSQYALEPYMSGETLFYHYGKHHTAYDQKLAGLIGRNSTISLEQWVALGPDGSGSSPAIFNQAGQDYNHNIYWRSMAPHSQTGVPSEKLQHLIDSRWGNSDAMQAAFSQAALTVFGSGWTWLVYSKATGQLEVMTTPNAHSPQSDGSGSYIILLACDVWEHSYYLDYRNERDVFIKNYFQIANWNYASESLENGLA